MGREREKHTVRDRVRENYDRMIFPDEIRQWSVEKERERERERETHTHTHIHTHTHTHIQA